MLQPQERVGRQGARRGRLAHDVAALEQMADQRPAGRVDRALGPLLQLAQLANVVQDCAGHGHRFVQRRVKLVVILGVLISYGFVYAPFLLGLPPHKTGEA